MIVPMLKYHFLVFHKEYNRFLCDLQKLGVVHVNQKDTEISDELKNRYSEISQYQDVIHFLEKRNVTNNDIAENEDVENIFNTILKQQEKWEELHEQLEEHKKAWPKASHWGAFSRDLIQKLKENGIELSFYSCSKRHFKELQKQGLAVELISIHEHHDYFALIGEAGKSHRIDAEVEQLPPLSTTELKTQIKTIKARIKNIEDRFDHYAATSIPSLKHQKEQLIQALLFEEVIHSTEKQANEKLMILEGWVPVSLTSGLNEYLETKKIINISERPSPNDKIPVLLKNNRFSRLFEPIGSMFSLPEYSELDLTVFFAPFFMLFFGFCLGDAGYGFLFLIGGGLYKFKARKEFRPYLSLIQFLGIATILFGVISGTFFGINLIETELKITEEFRHLFLNPDKMFNLALLLGAIQILFGLFIRAVNRTKQFGFAYSLATYGWLIILLGSVAYVVLAGAEIIPPNKTILYSVFGIGGFFVLFFSDPGVNVFARIGKGVWDVYSTVTGIFGDLLSYIRLFALGLSSAILGFVINDIGLQILGASKILGPIFFVLFLLIGHTLNILISSLGSFVHPMRLTFVEFYKSAGFKGGGEEYKPFKK